MEPRRTLLACLVLIVLVAMMAGIGSRISGLFTPGIGGEDVFCSVNLYYTVDSVEFDSDSKELVIKVSNQAASKLHVSEVMVYAGGEILQFDQSTPQLTTSPDIGDGLETGRSAYLKIDLSGYSFRGIARVEVLNVCGTYFAQSSEINLV